MCPKCEIKSKGRISLSWGKHQCPSQTDADQKLATTNTHNMTTTICMPGPTVSAELPPPQEKNNNNNNNNKTQQTKIFIFHI